ncbi:radical SAM family heme chaperone HemW [Sphingorhabdus pulchriflava]|uniref:radical SAM family heme chaperone HemW n=1 Tax=Sphingorhabdus pulchriflava TaxID=2292257 RepID=UPI001EF00349|nr:radical SAM family heme chaperone HemW [Sphingorhabdus pulchriflava]
MSDTLALYIHWPFCVSKCPYCDFNSHVREQVGQQAWREALLADLAHEARLTEGRKLGSIFFGGGTPSLMPPETAAALIEAAEQAWGFADDIEITLEANPSSVEAARFAELASAGVNRVSLGLQALDDTTLAFLGRAHQVEESLSALDAAQLHFDRVSIDLIYARPHQTPAQWEAELARAIGFGTTHMSLYQLTIEPGTRFATDVAKQQWQPLDDDAAADLYELTQARMEAAGLPAYEISNHAATGQESHHNLTYWRYQDYAGVGPGAHGRRGGMATQRHRKPENFLSAVARNAHGLQVEDSLDPATQAMEALLMGLRLREGVDISALSIRFAIDSGDLIDWTAVEKLEGMGFVTTSPLPFTGGAEGGPERAQDSLRSPLPLTAVAPPRLRLPASGRGEILAVTPKGFPLLDAILPQIVAIEPAPDA